MMRWAIGAGRYAEQLAALASTGVKVPMMEERPTLSPRAVLVRQVWSDLCGERSIGFALGPIPWRAIAAWCDRYGVNDAEAVIELVQALDTAWLKNESDTSVPEPHRDSGHAQNPLGYGVGPIH